MSIPDRLKSVMELFAANGQFFRDSDELFTLISWVQVMLGQGIHSARLSSGSRLGREQ